MEGVIPSADFPSLYDFENVFEEPIAVILRTKTVNAQGLAVYTRLNCGTLERESARLEVVLRLGDTTRQAHVIKQSDGTQRFARWHGNLSLTVVTPTAGDDSSNVNLHGKWRAIVRDVAESLYDLINPNLPYHWLDEIVAAGTTPTFRGIDGYEASTLVYGVQLSIKADAWPAT